MPFILIILFPSTIIKLEIALINVSILLIVRERAKKIIIIDSKNSSFDRSKEKKARSGITEELADTAIKPVKPIMKTTGMIIKKEKNKLFFKTLLFLAAYTLCQLP